MPRVLAIVLAVAVCAVGICTVLAASQFSMDGEGGSLRDLPAGFWFLLAIGVASFLLLTVGVLLRDAITGGAPSSARRATASAQRASGSKENAEQARARPPGTCVPDVRDDGPRSRA
jgi:hypothetical protein